ncbi:MAG: hypothetical protein ABR991_08170 [Terracidiphilus sp.]|jgi:hypothetical protein
MKDKAHNSEHDHLIEEIKDRQSNTLWHDAMKNSRGVDEFLWRGSPNALLVQRIGAWIFGLAFLIADLAILDITYKKFSWPDLLVFLVSLMIGGKIFLNGFRKNKTVKHKSK